MADPDGSIVVLRAPDGYGTVTLTCPMDAQLAADIMQRCARAGWEFDTAGMRAEGVPMSDRRPAIAGEPEGLTDG